MQCIEQDSLSRRRSIYGLGKLSSSADKCILSTLEDCLKHCPSPFNVQSARLVILFGESHTQFWNMVYNALLGVISAAQKKSVEQKISSFQQAHGTILFFEDTSAVQKLKKQFPLYKKDMKTWALQANAMLEFMIWQTLAENDIGASLQHYNDLIDVEAKKHFNLPKTWQIVAQMPFGSIEKEPADKTFLPLEQRMKIFY